MKRRRGPDPAGRPQESCGVWLDAAAFKRRKLPNLIGKKPVLRILNHLPAYSSPSKAPLPHTKQTNISTFFRAQQSGETGIHTNKQMPVVASSRASDRKDREWPAGERTPILASLTQPGVTQECKQDVVMKPQYVSPWNSIEAQSSSCVPSAIKGEASSAQGRDPHSLIFGRHWEGGLLDQVTVPKSPLREKMGGWEKEKPATLASQSAPKLKAVSDKRTKGRRKHKPSSPCSESSFMESSDTENIDPQLEENVAETRPRKNFSKTLHGSRLKTNDGICNSDNGCETVAANSLFSQDSDGHRVISHRSVHEQVKQSLQKQPQPGKSRSGVSPSHKGFRAAADSGEQRPPRISPRGSRSVLADVSQQSCYDLLFTEDSEGNKVIKHS